MNTVIDYDLKALKGVCKAKHLKKSVHSDDNIYWNEHRRILQTKTLSQIALN